MPTTWTPEQQLAITTRDHTILLSAAAGSGKTAVLTERIIRLLTEDAPPMDLSRLLAVTFTRAAAKELKDRIAAALALKVQERPNDARLARQIRLLPTANICTIDAFCGDLVRRFASRAGVSEGFRVADQQETDLVRISLMETLIEDAYAGVVPGISADTFADFVTHLYALREESSLCPTLLGLIDKMETLENGVQTLYDFADSYAKDAESPLMDTAWGGYLRRHCTDVGQHFIAKLNRALDQNPLDTAAERQFAVYLDAHFEAMAILANPRASYERLRTLPYVKFPAARKSKTACLADEVKAVCNEFRNTHLKKELASYMRYTEEEWKTLFRDLSHYTRILAVLAEEFSQRAARESRRRGAYSFAQIERLAYDLLVKDGKRTPLAEDLAREYEAVCVDEYQDVSPLQHALFAALAGERSRFMVGDIKQSIYRFRHADPSIFANLRREFPSPEQAPNAPAISLFMSLNFRCDKPIVDYVNHVFETLFGAAGESIGYTDKDALGFGKKTDGVALFPKPVLAVFENEEAGLDAVSDGAALTNGLPDAAHVAGGGMNPLPDLEAKDAYTDPEDDAPDAHKEAMWVASTIRDLLDRGTLHDGVTPIRPSDIAVLLRNKQSKVLPFLAALAAYGIDADTPEAVDFFSCPEVLLTLSLLRTVDNPRRDVPLTATLLSPLYAFTPDDLVIIRRGSPDGIPLYDALVAYCTAHPDFTRGTRFLSQLASFRDTAEGVRVDHLLRRLLTETPLMAIAGADGKGGENNVRLFYHYALRFGGEGEGLYQFIHYIDRQIETGKTFSPPVGQGEEDRVSVMTVHSSKGLEFPVIFLADCGAAYSTQDTKAHYIFDGENPVAFLLRDDTGLVSVKNPVRALVAHNLTEMGAEEEMRLLYVALTRARERLYISGTLRKGRKPDRMLTDAKEEAKAPTRFSVLRRKSYISLLLLAQARHPESVELQICPTFEEPAVFHFESLREPSADPTAPSDRVAALISEYSRRFAAVYPHTALTRIPGKLSVSRLTPSLLDGTEEEVAYLEQDTPFAPVITDILRDALAVQEEPPAKEADPALTEHDPAAEDVHEKYRRMPEAWAGARAPDPTERGIISHQFMQFCNFDRFFETGVDAELARLVGDGFLSEKDAALVRPEELEKFRVSRLLADMRAAKHIMREFRFHVRLPAADFTTDDHLRAAFGDQLLLVQGVMDALVFDENDNITLIDYKTDRLTHAERADPRLAAAKLKRRHAPQLRYYAAAVEKIFGRKPARILLYSLHLGDSVELNLD